MDDELYYLHTDHLGSTSLVTDESGNEVGRAAYDPYGNLIDNTIPLTLTERLFTGQIWEDELDLYNYRARFYDPLTGSFTQPDSLVPNAVDPRAWNRFGYVYGNPANFVDPSGHIAISPWDILDVASFGLSLNDFIQNPSWANAGWLALDAVGLLPLVPALGAVSRAGMLGVASSSGRRILYAADGTGIGGSSNNYLRKLVHDLHDMIPARGQGDSTTAAIRLVNPDGDTLYVVANNYGFTKKQLEYIDNLPDVIPAPLVPARHIKGRIDRAHAEEIAVDYIYNSYEGQAKFLGYRGIDAYARWTICEKCDPLLRSFEIIPLNPR